MQTRSTRSGIPTVTVVLGIACVVPFALAALDDRHGAGASPDDEAYVGSRYAAERAARAELERAEAEAEAEAAAAEAAQPTLAADVVVTELLSPARAVPGEVFRAVQLGGSSGEFLPEAARVRVDQFRTRTGASVEYDFDEWTLHGITVTAAADDAAVAAAVTQLWSEPTMVGSRQVWLGEMIHGRFGARASLEARFDEVTFVFDRYLPVDALLADPASPLPILGQPIDGLGAALGVALHGEEGRYFARLPGLGTDGAECKLDVAANLKTRRAREYLLGCDLPTAAALRDALVERWGQPTVDADSGDLRWRTGKVTRVFTLTDDGFVLTVSS